MITLTLPLPCPLNALYRAMPVKKGNHRFSMMVKSKRGREREVLLVSEIRKQLGGSGPGWTAAQASITVYPRDRRTPDGDAYLKQLFDCLEKSGVVQNDKAIVDYQLARMEPRFPGSIELSIWSVGHG